MSTLTEKQQERKQRLAKLQSAHNQNAQSLAKTQTQPQNDLKRVRQDNEPILQFKSYQPSSKELLPFKSLQPLIGEDAKLAQIETLEFVASEHQAKVLREEALKNPELDIANLAPKKPNWDLKRDLKMKLDKLDRMTQIAVSDQIRKRLIHQGDLSQLASLPVDKMHDE